MSIHPYRMNGGVSPYMDSRTDKPSSGTFLNKQILAVYHGFYYAGNQEKRETPGTIENIITTLKDQFGNTCQLSLDQASENLKQILSKDLPEILEKTGKKELMVCVVPRSKAENTYSSSQLLFKKKHQRLHYQSQGLFRWDRMHCKTHRYPNDSHGQIRTWR